MTPTFSPKPPEAAQENLFCSQCGKATEYGAIFCRNCGAGILSPTEVLALRRPVEESVSQVRPWVRLWARVFDITLWTIVVGFFSAIYFPAAFKGRVGELGIDLFVFASWMLVESVFVSAIGTTPGKSLLKIELLLPDNKSIPFLQALNRSFKVWWRGLGAGFGLVMFFTLLHAESVLTRDSRTSWDREGGFIVRHEKIGIVRTSAATVFLAVFYGAVLWGTVMGK